MINNNYNAKQNNTIQYNTLFNKNIKRNYSNLSPLKCDTVSFVALKKSQFSGIDLLVVNKFKAPIEKFRNNGDFQRWCKEKTEVIASKNYEAKDFETEIQRNEIIDDWIIYLNDYNHATCLLILDSITKELNAKNNKLPLPFDVMVLSKTLKEIENEIKNNPKYDVNFSKLYLKNLRDSVLQSCVDNLDDTKIGWIKIPSLEHDYDNFESNLLKLKLLSHSAWCMSGSTAEARLEFSDFHIYLEKGVPVLAMNIVEGKVGEIEGIKNDLHIPAEYLDLIKGHIEGMELSDTAKREFEEFKIS